MKKFIVLLCVLFFVWNCSDTDIIDATGKMQLSEFNLPELPEGYHYEGWLLVDASFVSVGKITNDSLTAGIARFDRIDRGDLSSAQSFAVTVESGSQSGPPSNYVLLLGNFEGNTALLKPDITTLNGVKGLSSKISGGYTVQNATVPPAEAGNYGSNGIWFFKGEAGNREAALDLDYTGLNYQAWLIKKYEGVEWNLNMGVMKSDTLADNWRGFIPLPFTENIPRFPGEDFLINAGEDVGLPNELFPTDVRGGKIIVTPIFSNYNNVGVPFPIHLLEANVPENAQKDPNLLRPLEVNLNFAAKAVKL